MKFSEFYESLCEGYIYYRLDEIYVDNFEILICKTFGYVRTIEEAIHWRLQNPICRKFIEQKKIKPIVIDIIEPD